MTAKKHMFWKAAMGLFALAVLLCVVGCGDDDSESEVQTTQTTRTGTIYFVPNCFDGVYREVVTQQFECDEYGIMAIKIKLQKNPFESEYFTFKYWSKYTSDSADTREKIIADEAEETLTYDAYFNRNGNKNRYGIVLYAEWEPLSTVSYTVVYDVNGGTAEYDTISKTQVFKNASGSYGNSLLVQWTYSAENLYFSRTGYKNNGWNTEPDGSGTQYAEGQVIAYLTEEEGATITLYAQWEKCDYSVVFDANGGEGTMESQRIGNNEETSLSANVFTRTGYAFTGWNTAADGSGTAYTNGQAVRNLAKENDATVTLYAQWTALTKITVPMSDVQNLTLGSTVPYYQVTVTGEYTDLGMQYLTQKLKNAGTKIYLDLSALTGTGIDTMSFSKNTNLVSVVLPSAATAIAEKAFSGCTNLESVTLGDGITTIGSEAFYSCSNLKTITIPDSVTTIDGYAFFSSGLVSVSIGTGLTTLPFYNCSSLETITIADGNATYKSSDGIVYSKDVTSLVFCPRGKTGAVEIPDTVTKIIDFAFSGCSKITSVNMGSNIQTIGSYAFKDCTQLADIALGENVQTIGQYAFENCTGLTTILFPASVTQIGSYAFKGCTKLATAYFTTASGWKTARANGWRTEYYNVALIDAEQNAGYLRDTYSEYTWTREE